MATKVDEALAEINTELARIEPIHEGLRDYALLDITPDTLSAVNAAIAQYDTRVALLLTVKNALKALLADGYPTLDIPAVDKSVFDDLSVNYNTILAALGQFSVNEATTLGIVPGTPTHQ